jgi:hypothetical protein
MADFINTIDVLGDDAVTDSVIDRSIAEFFDKNIDAIGAYAFYGCSNLTSIDLPAVTSIGKNAFQKCSLLSSINLPMATELGGSSFSSCEALTSINLPMVTELRASAFSMCQALTSVKVSTPLTIIDGYAFQNCTALTRLDFYSVQKWNSYSIYNCPQIDTVIIRDTSKVSTLSDDVLRSTKIRSGAGYIYVPASLVDSYKNATNWSNDAAQIRAIEDYPDICGG